MYSAVLGFVFLKAPFKVNVKSRKLKFVAIGVNTYQTNTVLILR